MQDSVPSQYQTPEPPHGGGGNSGSAGGGPGGFFGGTRGRLAALAAALVVGLIAGFLLHGSSKAAAAPAPTVTVVKTVAAPTAPGPTDGSTATATATATSNATGSDSPGATTGPNATGLGTVSLIDLQPASGRFNSSDAKPTLGGQAQTLAVSDPINGGCGNNSASNDVGYDLGKNYTQFTGTFGIDDASPDETLAPSVEIDGDGLKLGTYTPKLGHSVQVTLNVTGVLRLDIKWSETNNTCGSLGYLVIGNGQLTTVPGYHPSPAASSN